MKKTILKTFIEKISKSESVLLRISGNSMYPTMCNGDEIRIEFCEFEKVQVDDIIACYFDNLDHFIVHRVISIEKILGKTILITKGDNNDYIDAKVVRQHNYVGIVKKREEVQASNVFRLASDVFYMKDRKCVIKYENTSKPIPLELIPPIVEKTTRKINRALTTELIILLSYRCNLGCIYCSNNSGNSNDIYITTKKENITKSINYVVKNALILQKIKQNTSTKSARIIVSGGGEPTIEWELLSFIVDTVNSLKKKYGDNIVQLTILTNGQIDNKKADYLINNFDSIAISCDGFSTQDKQRPRINGDSSKKYLENFLIKLNEKNKQVSIRMTITGEALSYLQKDIDYFFTSFKVIKDIIIEPFVQVGRGADENIKQLNYDEFINIFDLIVRKYYENVFNSISLLEDSNDYPCQRLSGVSLVLSPYNVITCCDTATPESIFWESMIMGPLEEGSLKVLNEYTYSIPDNCKSCIALDFCAGGCPMHLNNLDANEKQEFCHYVKNMVKQELVRRVELSKKARDVEVDGEKYRIYSLPRRDS